METKLESERRLYRFAGVKVSKNGGPYRAVNQVSARPGMRLRARVTLRPNGGGPDKIVELPFRLPRNEFPAGYLLIRGARRVLLRGGGRLQLVRRAS